MKNEVLKYNNYKMELAMINNELKKLPEGYLIQKGRFYYQVINQKQIGITKNPEKVALLYRKKHLLDRKSQLNKNMSITNRYINKSDGTLQYDAIRSFPKAYQSQPLTHFFHPTTIAWIEAPFAQCTYPFKGRKLFSKGGVRVRSKSEVFIANQLEDYGIPYRYEAALTLDDQTNHPDFTALNPFSAKKIIWEHFGAFNQSGYEDSMNNKMNLYTSHGFVPFDTFIYTFEYEVGDPRRLQELIENVILGI